MSDGAIVSDILIRMVVIIDSFLVRNNEILFMRVLKSDKGVLCIDLKTILVKTYSIVS